MFQFPPKFMDLFVNLWADKIIYLPNVILFAVAEKFCVVV